MGWLRFLSFNVVTLQTSHRHCKPANRPRIRTLCSSYRRKKNRKNKSLPFVTHHHPQLELSFLPLYTLNGSTFLYFLNRGISPV